MSALCDRRTATLRHLILILFSLYMKMILFSCLLYVKRLWVRIVFSRSIVFQGVVWNRKTVHEWAEAAWRI